MAIVLHRQVSERYLIDVFPKPFLETLQWGLILTIIRLRMHASRTVVAVPQRELAETLSSAQLVLLRRFPRAHQIPQRRMRNGRTPHRRQVTGPMAACQLPRVAAIRLDPIVGLHADQRGGHHRARHAQRRQLPIQHIAGRPASASSPVSGSMPTDSASCPATGRPRPYRPPRPPSCRVDIETNEAYLAHDRLLSMWLCVVQCSNSQRNPRTANRAGRSIVTKYLLSSCTCTSREDRARIVCVHGKGEGHAPQFCRGTLFLSPNRRGEQNESSAPRRHVAGIASTKLETLMERRLLLTSTQLLHVLHVHSVGGR